MDRRRLRAIARRLAKAYGTPPPPRHLPPLEELVLTVLSQHTSDTNRDRAYADLRRRFADWDEVADAPLPALARAIRRGGLGPTKAVRIRAMLRGIRDGGVPLDDRAFTAMTDQGLWDTLVALPGVGPKTAACVLLFSLDRPFFPVDTHVHRVAKRLGLVPARADAVLPTYPGAPRRWLRVGQAFTWRKSESGLRLDRLSARAKQAGLTTRVG